jgi:Immunity protein 53
MNALIELQHWYSSQCNGEWEHSFGITIGTLDNPGWTVEIDLDGTFLKELPFAEISRSGSDDCWIRCWREGLKFKGVGDTKRLEEILGVFLSWASSGDGD